MFAPPPPPNMQPPQIPAAQYTDPLQTLAQIGQLRTQGLQQQSAGLALQQKQLEIQSTRGLMQAWQDAGGDLDKLSKIASDPKYQIAPSAMMTMQTNMAALTKERAQTSLFGSEAAKNNQAATDARHDAIYNAYQPVWDEKDPMKQQALIQQINPQLLKQGYKPDELMPTGNPDFVQQAKAGYTTMTNIRDMAEKQVKAAQAAQATAEAGKLTLDQQLTQHKIDLYNTLTQNPDALAKRVAGSIDATKYPDLYNRALNEARSAPDIEGINAAIQKYGQLASEQEKTIATETNPDVIRARVGQRVAEATATAPIETAKAIATAKALRQGDNPAVAGVAPAAVAQVQSQAIKLDEQYAKEKAATDAIGRVLDLAQSGNKAAGTNLPLLGVETLNGINGIKRINTAEIHQYEQAGSLWDQIVGKIGKLTTGQPIPKDVMDDIRTLHQVLGQQSYQNYNDSLNSLNSRTGSRFAPTLDPPNVRRTPAVGGGAAATPGGKRTTLNGREIVPRQGAWYYKDTGERVK